MIRPCSRVLTMIATSMFLVTLAGCGGGDSGPTSSPAPDPTPPPPPPTPVATSIAVTPASHTLATIGATVQLNATVRDQNNNTMTGQTVTWTSSNTGVATVSGNGLVTAVANGTSQITARSGNASGTASITVAEPVPTRIAISPASHTLEAVGATVQLSATVRDQRNNAMSGQPITWSSGDEAVATVSGDGLVTAVGNGMTEITAKSGSLSATAEITVAIPVATSLTIEPAEHTLEAVGQSVQLAAVVLDQHGNAMEDEAVTWSSGDEAVATVDENGLVTAVDNGMAEISAEAGDAMGTAAITVAQVPAVVVIEVDPEATTLTEIGQTLQLTASVSDANENPIADAAVTWSSGDEMVVTVDMDGLVEAVGNGMADVTAASGDVSDMVSITVMAPSDGDDGEGGDMIEYVPWEGVTVAPDTLTFKSDTFILSVTGCFTENPAVRLLLPPDGKIKDWHNNFTMDTLTIHYSIWQRSDDMGGTWNDVEGTRVMYDACVYEGPDDPGEYRLVGDITLNSERSFRKSENTFTIP